VDFLYYFVSVDFIYIWWLDLPESSTFVQLVFAAQIAYGIKLLLLLGTLGKESTSMVILVRKYFRYHTPWCPVENGLVFNHSVRWLNNLISGKAVRTRMVSLE